MNCITATLHKMLSDSAVNERGRERKGPPETIQKFCLRKWPISNADFPMTPMEQSTLVALLERRMVGEYPAAFAPGPFRLLLTYASTHRAILFAGTRLHCMSSFELISNEIHKHYST